MLDHERQASDLLMNILKIQPSGLEVRDRHDSGKSIHDFDLVRQDGYRIAVEVTRDASEVDRAFAAELTKAFPICDNHLKNDWYISARVPSQAADNYKQTKLRIRSLIENLPIILAKAEQTKFEKEISWIGGYSRHTDDPDLRLLKDQLRELGITNALRSASHSHSQINVQVSSFRGFLGPDCIRDVVDRHVNDRSDNRKKLANAKDLMPRKRMNLTY